MNALESIGLQPEQVSVFMACHATIAPPEPSRRHAPKPDFTPRIYQSATCCGIDYRRWRYADRPFKITDQTCLHCELPLRWHTTNRPPSHPSRPSRDSRP